MIGQILRRGELMMLVIEGVTKSRTEQGRPRLRHKKQFIGDVGASH